MRILVAGVVAGLAMFVWSGLANLALPLGKVGILAAPSEAAAQAALKSSFGQRSGLYVLPMKAMSGEAKTSPAAVVTYLGNGESFGVTPAKLMAELVMEVLLSVLAAALLSQTRLYDFLPRLGFVVALGLFAAVMTNTSNMIWFAYPLDYTLAYAATQLIGFAIAGAVIAALIRPRRAL